MGKDKDEPRYHGVLTDEEFMAFRGAHRKMWDGLARAMGWKDHAAVAAAGYRITVDMCGTVKLKGL